MNANCEVTDWLVIAKPAADLKNPLGADIAEHIGETGISNKKRMALWAMPVG